MRLDRFGQYKPQGPSIAQSSPATAAICPFSPSARNEDQIAAERFAAAIRADPLIGRYEAAYVGAATEHGYRSRGSSGGLVSWVAAELLRLGLVDGVAHVVPGTPGSALFTYRISRSLSEIAEGAKSRYYPVELSGVLSEIAATPGRYAVVGIPCFIKAVQLLRARDKLLGQRIVYTLGLFCGHMKSARFAESLAWQLGATMEAVEQLDFRIKDEKRPANWYRADLRLHSGARRAMDWWHLADGDWGAGFFQNSACNFCDDVVAETADIAFGDAWVEPYSTDGRGTNVVIVRHPALHRLLRGGLEDHRLELAPVGADFVVATQAAGLRQRREGLAYRLARRHHGLRPVKRVSASRSRLPLRRRLVYRMREGISRWSHRIFWLARMLGRPVLYLWWARTALSLYQSITYSRGPLGRLVDRLLGQHDR